MSASNPERELLLMVGLRRGGVSPPTLPCSGGLWPPVPRRVRRRSESAATVSPATESAATASDASTWLSAGFTLIELIASMTILLLLTSAALPLARLQVQREREMELRRDLRDIREAIDRYKDFSDRAMIPTKADTFGYPPDLDTLVKGVEIKGAGTAKYKFLRHIPIDPMTGRADWGMRSMQDDPDSTSWGGENVFDVYTQGQGTAMDGTRYADW